MDSFLPTSTTVLSKKTSSQKCPECAPARVLEELSPMNLDHSVVILHYFVISIDLFARELLWLEFCGSGSVEIHWCSCITFLQAVEAVVLSV